MKEKHQLAALQLAIMQVLWERGEATVADVRNALKETRPLAHTTIGTMLAKMKRNDRCGIASTAKSTFIGRRSNNRKCAG